MIFKKIIININKYYKLRIDKLISIFFLKYKRSSIKKNIINKQLIINNKLINKPDKKILLNKKLNIKFNTNFLIKKKNKYPILPYKIKLNFIEINNNYLILNKPYNLSVDLDNNNKNNSLINAICYYYPENKNLPKYGIVHRLDKNTTGLMIIARNLSTFNYFKKLFKLHIIKRFYDTIIYGSLNKKTGIINLPIKRHSIKKICMSVNLLGKKAITLYHIKEKINNFTRLNLQLKTGKTHQIRVHLSYLNHPIIGDNLYYNNNYNYYKKQLNINYPILHSYKIGFKEYKTNIYREWIIPLPIEYINILKLLKKIK